MAIVQCPNHHYYDNNRNDQCPYCEKLRSEQDAGKTLNEQQTSYMNLSVDAGEEQQTEGYGEEVSSFEKTIGVFTDETQNLLTVGWLVCLSGGEKGKSYVIHPGRNFAGRSLDMDLVLSDDSSIARQKHFSIVYDPKSIEFYVVFGSGSTYVNGVPLASQQKLTEGDVIQAGHNRYMFIPFCKEGRDWN